MRSFFVLGNKLQLVPKVHDHVEGHQRSLIAGVFMQFLLRHSYFYSVTTQSTLAHQHMSIDFTKARRK